MIRTVKANCYSLLIAEENFVIKEQSGYVCKIIDWIVILVSHEVHIGLLRYTSHFPILDLIFRDSCVEPELSVQGESVCNPSRHVCPHFPSQLPSILSLFHVVFLVQFPYQMRGVYFSPSY